MTEKNFSWGELADFTHAKQVEEFGFCSCEDNEGKPNPFDDCPNEEKKCSCSLPEEKGWHLDDEVITTRRELEIAEKQNYQNALGYFLNVYYKKGDAGLNALAEYLEAVESREVEVFCQWEA